MTPRRSAARRWLVIVSLAVHVGAILAYVAVGMWRIERLTPEKKPIEIVVGRRMENPGGGPWAGHKPPPIKPPQVTKVHVVKLVQPVDRSTQVAVDQTPSTAVDTTNGNDLPGNGDPTKPPGDGCTDPDCSCTGPECGTAKTVTKPVVEPPKPPPTLAPMDVAKMRLSGDTQIEPPDVTKTTMMRDGKTRVLGIVKFCMDIGGRVTSASTLKPTGYPDYDAELVRGVRGWLYRPYFIAGKPIPACSTVAFAYSMH